MPIPSGFQGLLEAAAGICLVVDPEPPRFTVVAVSDRFLGATGQRRGDVVGRGALELLGGAPELPEVMDALARVSRTATTDAVAERTYTIVGAEGARADQRWRLRISPVTAGDGRPVCLVVHVEDESADRAGWLKDEVRLRTLEAVVVNANDAVVVTEPAPLEEPGPRIIYVNDAFTRMTGYTAPEVIGRSPRLLHGPGTDAEGRAALRRALARGEAARVELLNYKKDGTPFWVDISLTPVRDADGRLKHWASVQRDVTRRREAEAAAVRHASEAAERRQAESARVRVEGILESISDAFLAFDAQWRFTYVNHRTEEILGRSRAELMGRAVWEIFPQAWDSSFGRLYREAMQTQEKRALEDYSPVTGRWLEMHAYPSKDGLTVYFQDVTERHRIEVALRESERRYRSLFDNSMDAVLLTAPDGRIMMVNHAATELFGYSEAEMQALGRQAIVDPSDPRLEAALAERRRTGRFRGELFMKTKGGARIPTELSSAIFDDDGGEEWTSMFIRDITERVRAEEGLRASQRLLSGIFEILPVGLSIADPEGRFVRVNQEAMRIWGRASAGLSELGDLEAWWGNTGERLRADDWPLARAIARGERTVAEVLRIRALDGSEKTVLASALPLYDEQGHRAGVVVVNEDVSKLKETEEALRRAVHARDEVLGIVAHDLRNPLNALLLQLQSLRSRRGQPERRNQRGLEAIERHARRMNRLIQDLLDVARIEAGALSIEREWVDTRALLLEVIESQRSLADAASLEVGLELPGVPPAVFADRLRLAQVLENLLGNAIKFTPAGGHISVGAAASEGGTAFFVTDTGEGIAAEQMPRLFDAFWQATKTNKRGAGLGLSIAKGIVDAHGGRIWAESRPGQGTSFYVTIPAPAPEARRGDTRPPPPEHHG